MRELFDEIERVNILSGEDITPEKVLVKLMEESGEIAEALSHINGFKPGSEKSIPELIDHLMEESVDAMLCIISLVKLFGVKYDSVIERFPKKIAKWESKVIERNNKRNGEKI